MSKRTQIGPAVDADLWRRFRHDVESRKGQIRGVLGDELENAIRQYISDEARPVEKRIDARLARIEDSLGVTNADGGTDTPQSASHTHAPTSKPAANAATERKVQYLAECVNDQEVADGLSLKSIPRETLADIVTEEYGFRDDTADRYVDQLIEHFELVPHPVADNIFVTESVAEDLRERQREATADEASDQLNDLTNQDK